LATHVLHHINDHFELFLPRDRIAGGPFACHVCTFQGNGDIVRMRSLYPKSRSKGSHRSIRKFPTE
jgi:hypothetical protein